jgi:uncharacterized protein (DUF885 family)
MPTFVRLTAALLLAAGAAPAPALAQAPAPAAAAQDQNAELAAFFDAYDKAALALSPMAKAYRGIRDGDYGEWTDDSDAAQQARFELGQRTRADMLARFRPEQLSGQSLLSYQLFDRQMERQRKAWAWRRYGYVFDQMNGAQSQYPAFLINIHRVSNLAEARAYVSRLERMGAAIDQAIANARASAAEGVAPPKWVWPYVLADAGNVTTGARVGQKRASSRRRRSPRATASGASPGAATTMPSGWAGTRRPA